MLSYSRSFLCVASLLLSGLCLVGSDQPPPSKLQIHRWTEQLSSKDWILQAEALQALGTWKVEASIPLVTEVFKSGESDWVRGRAMITLGEIQGDQISERSQISCIALTSFSENLFLSLSFGKKKLFLHDQA